MRDRESAAIVRDTRTRTLQGIFKCRHSCVGLNIGCRAAAHCQCGQCARDGHVRLSHLQRVLARGGVVVRVRGAHFHGLRAHLCDARHRGAPRCTVVLAVFDDDAAVVAADNSRGRGRRMQLGAVIDLRQRAAARAGQRDVGRRNRKRARLHRDIVVRVVARRRSHCDGIGSHVLTSGPSHRVGRVDAVRRLAGYCGGVGGGIAAVVVIYLRVVIGGDGDGHLVDGQRAVGSVHGELRRHVVVAGILHDGRTRNRVGVRAGIGSAHAGRQSADGVLMSVHREAQRLETGNRFRRTVIIVCGAIGHHRDVVWGGTIGYRQRTIRTCDVVVGRKSAAVQRVSKGVVAAAHEGLRTGHVVGRALPTYEAARSDAHGAVGQRVTVVLLGSTSGG